MRQNHMIIFFYFASIFILTSYFGYLGFRERDFELASLAIGFGVVSTAIVFEYYIRVRSLKERVAKTSARLQIIADEVFDNLPIGILTYNENYEVDWANSFTYSILPKFYIGDAIKAIDTELYNSVVSEYKGVSILNFNNLSVKVHFMPKNRAVYFFENEEYTRLNSLYKRKKVAFGFLQLDNFEEVIETLGEHEKSNVNARFVTVISNWAKDNNIFLKNLTGDKYMFLLENESLTPIINSKFEILNDVRKVSNDLELPITLSLGVAKMENDIIDVGFEAQRALDFAISRGGDQVAVKIDEKPIQFFGGQSTAFAKRDKTKSRMIAHSLSNLIDEASEVLIMSHVLPDPDALASAIAMAKIVKASEKPFYIVLDSSQYTEYVKKMIEFAKTDSDSVIGSIVTRDEAKNIASSKSLLVIVDTHNPDMTIEPELVYTINNIVVIDHHRRGSNYIHSPQLLHQEPYASSTVELITELVEYYPLKVELTAIEATLMLTGIIVDTNSFTYRTGARTFEAASILRKNGGDMIKVHSILRENLTDYQAKASLVDNVVIINKNIAIVAAPESNTYKKPIIAQVADSLLTIDGIEASFVIAKCNNRTCMSARSFGAINVQLVAEALGGGGHLTNAAASVDDATIEEFKEKLLNIVNTKKNDKK